MTSHSPTKAPFSAQTVAARRMTATPPTLAHAGLELTILMPCLNEARTLAACIGKARGFFERTGISGEIVIADNGSSDGSQALAAQLGARVVDVPRRGYGAALIAGIEAASGRFVIFGDSDDSYDFSRLDAFVAALRAGSDLVMGNRFKGGVMPGAMPPLHRYLGNPVLSFIGRLFFHTPVRDFHCGLRASAATRSWIWPSLRRHGVRQRDGGQGLAARLAHQRGAYDAAA